MRLNQLKFKLKAKGRHGTHSPFVYGFVENVLQKAKPASPDSEELLEEQIIFLNLISYLKVKHVIFFKKENFTLKELLEKTFTEIKISIENDSHFLKNFSNALIVTSIERLKKEDFKVFSSITNQDNFNLYLLNIHKDAANESIWSQIQIWENYQLSLDLWHAGLLTQSQSFKEKQHFLLK